MACCSHSRSLKGAGSREVGGGSMEGSGNGLLTWWRINVVSSSFRVRFAVGVLLLLDVASAGGVPEGSLSRSRD